MGTFPPFLSPRGAVTRIARVVAFRKFKDEAHIDADNWKSEQFLRKLPEPASYLVPFTLRGEAQGAGAALRRWRRASSPAPVAHAASPSGQRHHLKSCPVRPPRESLSGNQNEKVTPDCGCYGAYARAAPRLRSMGSCPSQQDSYDRREGR
jgi:hypothetical protein